MPHSEMDEVPDDPNHIACAPSYAPVSALDKLEQVPPLDTVLAESSFHALAEISRGQYGTNPDPVQQLTVAGGLLHSRERQELLRILDLPADNRSAEEIKLVVDLLTRYPTNVRAAACNISGFTASNPSTSSNCSRIAGPPLLKGYRSAC